MLRHSISILPWLLDLFNAPPRAEMTFRQKVGRSLLVTGTLTVLCILVAMAGATALFIAERVSRVLDKIPDLWTTASIILTGIIINAICVFLLFQVKKFDRKLMLDPGETPARS